MKRLIINLAKITVSVAIIAYLLTSAVRNASFSQLVDQPKNWGLLVLSFVLCSTAVIITLVRWYVLVRALELPFSLRDAFRLGFLGYLLNLVSPGSVGGDLFKAVYIAREQRGRRAEAVATVVVDRMIGLYALLLVASAAILLTGQLHSALSQIQFLSRATLLLTAIGAIAILMLLVPGFTSGAVSEFLGGLPRVGPTIERLIGAIRMYRRRVGMLSLSVLMSVIVHSLFTLGIYCIARGLPGQVPSLADHFLAIPLAMVAGALPISMAGLGVFEGSVELLYQSFSAPGTVGVGQGTVVALGYRIITILIALVGVVIYMGARREMAQVYHEAEEQQARDDPAADGCGSDARHSAMAADPPGLARRLGLTEAD